MALFCIFEVSLMPRLTGTAGFSYLPLHSICCDVFLAEVYEELWASQRYGFGKDLTTSLKESWGFLRSSDHALRTTAIKDFFWRVNDLSVCVPPAAPSTVLRVWT